MMTSVSIGNKLATLPAMTDTLGSYVRSKREARGWTQRRLAMEAGLNPAHLSQIESGKIALPNPDMRRNIARALGIAHIELLLAAGEITIDEVDGDDAVIRQTEAEQRMLPLIREIEWNQDRYDLVDGMLRLFRDADRRKSQ